jgi:dTDP-4-amino-4,6-dideoxygalactose transaminase
VSRLPFNRPFVVGKEIQYIREAIRYGHLSGDGPFTRKCQVWLEQRLGCQKALLTHSCTAALEMAALLADIQPGDEVIMPSYTFVSTANAFVLRGAVPVFVDVRPDTLNLDESRIEAAITPQTRAIVPVHYAGVACEMDAVMAIAERHGLMVIEDAAQALMSTYRGRPVGSDGHLAAVSFHETKNVMCGEGGALLINDRRWVDRAEIIREKGTNRSQFFRGQVDKYTWVDIGSSYLPSDLNAAFLLAQLEEGESITRRRLQLWEQYHEAFAGLECEGKVRRPVIPGHCLHNAHMYYLILESLQVRSHLLDRLRAGGIKAVFHYVALHSSPAGRKYGRADGDLPRTQEISDRLVRLPLWVGMTERDVKDVVRTVYEALGSEKQESATVRPELALQGASAAD